MSPYAYPETLVDTQWLSEHLEDPDVRIVEMDLNPESYEKGHIPGSIFWNAMTLTKSENRIDFEPKTMEELLGNSGISNQTTVVAVHDGFIATSGFIFWLLKVFGHDRLRILNGGRPKWIADGYPLTTAQTTVKAIQYQIKIPNDDLSISLAEVQKIIGQNDSILLDVRTPQEYNGELFMMKPPTENERAGHIPSAINLYYELAHNDDGTFKSLAELKEIFESKNITPEKLVIPYCAVGARSGHTWFILKYLLGYSKVKNYHGSWNEWSRIADLPVEK